MIKIKLNWDEEVKEITEKEQLKTVKIRKDEWKEGLSKDGYIQTWRKKYKYKGIAFELAILRYFNFQEGFKPAMSDRICDRHVVVEFPKETEELRDKVEDLNYCEFLYHDTLHSWNDKQNLNQQLQSAYIQAIEDINEIPSMLKKRLKEVKEIKDILKGLS